MRIELATEPGDPQRPNEDYASVALPAAGQGGALVLLDGVTPPEEDYGCRHTVPWFTAHLGGAMLELSVSHRDMTLAEVLSSAISRTADTHRATCDLSHARTPQATVIAARWSGDTVEYLVLSDSVLLLERADGSVQPVLDPRLDELPPAVQDRRAAVRALPRGSAERAAAGRKYAHAVEALRNAEGGFFTAAADPAVAARAVSGSVPRSGLRSLTALSDGASRWTEVFHEGSWADCVALVAGQGPQSLIDRVRAAEAADPEGAAFPRGKARDDAAVIFVAP
ncbi:Protein phosphatase 2C [Streptomyces sp. 2224.1]|uniref:protein phosphatase 2C domain-containing protein n=1 Tax=Streptomyces sp. 2224.1 TaxID=1881020 RepID=UPI0008960BB2|nr:protein phosphatase 2C domain-containing protein [Streptomyces sp. 2224.1]SEB55585.1 Protein phosphatase 2C [Streptomyces sp. 2224.1]